MTDQMTLDLGEEFDQQGPEPLGSFADAIFQQKYAMAAVDREIGGFTPPANGDRETWIEAADRVTDSVAAPYLDEETVEKIRRYIRERKFIPGGRYLYAAGRKFNQVNNCMLLSVEDSREGWADLANRATSALMTGAGIGVDYSALRPEGAHINGLGGQSTGPISLMTMVNEIGRNVMQGGSRRSAIWAGLRWDHPDVFKFIELKDWDERTKVAKAEDFNYPARMDMTNISVILDDEFFDAYHNRNGHPILGHPDHEWAVDVYNRVTEHMVQTGEPGFSIDTGENDGETLRNACTEITTSDDNDVCNLGSINLAKIGSLKELIDVTEAGTAFLLAGTLYSKLPYEEVYHVRAKNRRLGLGLMGLYEWLVSRGKRYGPDEDLGEWLHWWARTADGASEVYAKRLGVSVPVKNRAIAPNGTISIIGETTGGIEPVFASALKRRYLKGQVWHARFIIDQSAKRLVDQGVPPEFIEDAYDLAEDVERRVEFQHWVQQYVDHGISSTINLPAWESKSNNEGTLGHFRETLMKYLPGLRGITVYPDGARGGQPLTPADLEFALEQGDAEFQEYGNEHGCRDGVCGL